MLKLNKKVIELGLQVNTANQKAEHEANKLRSLQSEKEKVDLKLNEAIAEVQVMKERTSKAEEEAKKKLEETELENKALKEKILQLESGSTLNQCIIDTVMQKFFSSEAWKDAQVDNFISFGKLL